MSHGQALITRSQTGIAFIQGVLFFQLEGRFTIVSRMTLEDEADSYVRNARNLLLSNDTSHPKRTQWTVWPRSFTFNSNKSPTWCNSFSVYYPDVCLQLKMFRVFSAHHQKLNDCSGSLWFYLRIVVIAVLFSWSGRPENLLHQVGDLFKLCDDARTYKP